MKCRNCDSTEHLACVRIVSMNGRIDWRYNPTKALAVGAALGFAVTMLVAAFMILVVLS